PRQPSAPRAEQAEDTDDFAPADGQRNVFEVAGARQPFQPEHRLTSGGRCFSTALGHLAAYHQLGDFAGIEVFNGAGGDVFAVAQDGDTVGDARDFIQTMRDIDDGDVLRL